MKVKVLEVLSNSAFKQAKKNANSTCWGGFYEFKEPKSINMLENKQEKQAISK